MLAIDSLQTLCGDHSDPEYILRKGREFRDSRYAEIHKLFRAEVAELSSTGIVPLRAKSTDHGILISHLPTRLQVLICRSEGCTGEPQEGTGMCGNCTKGKAAIGPIPGIISTKRALIQITAEDHPPTAKRSRESEEDEELAAMCSGNHLYTVIAQKIAGFPNSAVLQQRLKLQIQRAERRKNFKIDPQILAEISSAASRIKKK